MRTDYPHHISGFDYVGFYRYFLTFCAHDRAEAFLDAEVVQDVTSQFLRAGADESFAIVACCFMPDHVHFVVEGSSENADLKRFVSRAKQFSGYHFARKHKKRLWRYGYERVLRDDESTQTVVKYVLENPVRAGLAQAVSDYPHITSSLYSREELIQFAYGSG